MFEKFRRAILASSMLGCQGKVQREGEVIHVIAEHLVDLSGELRRVSELDQPFRWPAGRGDAARQTGGPDPPSGTCTGSGASRAISTSRICGSKRSR